MLLPPALKHTVNMVLSLETAVASLLLINLICTLGKQTLILFLLTLTNYQGLTCGQGSSIYPSPALLTFAFQSPKWVASKQHQQNFACHLQIVSNGVMYKETVLNPAG